MTGAEEPGVVVLISGEGTNLQALIDASASGALPARVRGVLSDRPDARGLERARAAGADARVLERSACSDRAAWEQALAAAVDEHAPRAVVLAGFMRVLGVRFVMRFAGRMVNIHPSLLPRHRGLDTHRRVLDAGDAMHGASVHFVTERLDAGPCIIQYRLPVRDDDTPETLAAAVHRGEHIILPRAVAWLVEGRLRLAGEQVILDGRRLDEPLIVEGER